MSIKINLIFFTTFFLCFFLFYLPQEKLDFWLHLKEGEIIWQTKKIPQKDIFSFGETKKKILNQQWLTEIIFYLLYKQGKYLLPLFKALLGTITAFLLYNIMLKQTSNLLISSYFTLFFSSLVMQFYNLRPRMFTLFFLALILYIYQNFKYKNSKIIYLTPLLLIIWSSLHGGYIIGTDLFILITIIEFFKNIIPDIANLTKDKLPKKNLFILFTVTFTMSVITFLITYLQSYYKDSVAGEESKLLSWILEWIPVDIKASYNYLFIFYAVVGTIFVLFAIKKFDLLDLIMWMGGISLPFLAQRHIDIASVLTIPIINKYFIFLFSGCGEVKNKENKKKRNFYNNLIDNIKTSNSIKICIWLIAVQILLIYLFLVPFRFELTKKIFNEKKFEQTYLPIKGINFIKKNNPAGRMFNELDWGGLLLWYLYPKYKVVIDVRYSAVYKEKYLNQYMRTLFSLDKKNPFLEKMKINWVIIRNNRPLSFSLSRDKNWKLVYKDNICVIYIRKKLKTI